MHTTRFSLSYPSAEMATAVERSLEQEAGSIEGDRTEATVAREAATVSITIEASDLIALRAGHNTWLGLASVAERTYEAAAGQ